MKSKLSLLLSSACSGISALLLVACGDTVENVYQTGLEAYAFEDDLPKCTKDNENELAFVKEDMSTRVCMDGEWVSSKDTVYLEGGDFSCKTEELKDKSGLKIVCNGDSIGVVLNGSNGADGKNGEDFTKPDTTVNDSEKVAISLDSLVGVTQKGPFLKGSTVYLYELSDGHTLKQTNGNFTSNITSDDGRYKFSARDLVSQYAMVVVDGYYRNEVTGVTSEAPIRLKAITDMRKRSSVNVNILTHLEFDRVYYLVTRGDSTDNKLTVKQAKRQAQKEILKLFDIELNDDTDAEDMDVFGKKDADAALLALSILLQGDRTESDMMALLSEISNAIADNGEWKDAAVKSQIAFWAAIADGTGRLDSIYNNVKSWGLGGGNVPPFEKFVRNFYGVETGLGLCDGKDNYLGTKRLLKMGSDTLRFICEDTKKGWWRKLTQLDLDTLGWGIYFNEGDVRNGQVDTTLTYVFENGAWRHGTSLDSILGQSCIPKRKNTLLKSSTADYYICVGDTVVSFEGLYWTSVWRRATNDELDMNYWEEHWCEYSLEEHRCLYGILMKSPFTGRIMVWDADTLREPNLVEQKLDRACVSYLYDQGEETLSNGLAYTCSDTGWSKQGTFKDWRDYRIYKGVQIGNQIWMAENLNYETENSFCYNDSAKYCDKYGRLYTWAAAIGCRDGQTCTAIPPVQGACPDGWHLPSKSEWFTLLKEVGATDATGVIHSKGEFLKSQAGWNDENGRDAYSFSALPAGTWRPDEEYYFGEGDHAYFWSYTTGVNFDYLAYALMLYSYIMEYTDTGTSELRNVIQLQEVSKRQANSVRCIKD